MAEVEPSTVPGDTRTQEPLYKRNPLQAFGLLLSSVAAGGLGKPSPALEFHEQELKAQAQRQKELNARVESMRKMAEDVKKSDTAEGRQQGLAGMIQLFPEYEKPLRNMIGNPDSVVKSMALGNAKTKIAEMAKTLSKVAPEVMQDVVDEEGNVKLSLEDLVNVADNYIPKNSPFALSPDERAALHENPDSLASFGILSSKRHAEMQQAVETKQAETDIQKQKDIDVLQAETGEIKKREEFRTDEAIRKSEETPTNEMKNVEAAGYEPGSPEYNARLDSLLRKTPGVEDPEQAYQAAFMKNLAKEDAKAVEEVRERAAQARAIIPALEQYDAAAKSQRFETGAFGETREFLATAAQLFGLNPEEIPKLGSATTAAVMDSATKSIAAQSAERLSRVTNMSLQFIAGSLPSLMRTPEGNEIISEIARNTARAEQDVELILDRYTRPPSAGGFGTLYPKDAPSFYKAQQDYYKENPVVTRELRDRIAEVRKVAPKSWAEVLGLGGDAGPVPDPGAGSREPGVVYQSKTRPNLRFMVDPKSKKLIEVVP